jgi:hypothetical protein
VIPLRAGRQTHEMIGGSTLVSMDTGHVPFASRPEEFLGHVVPFLTSAFTARSPGAR